MSNVKKIVDTLQGAISEQTKKAESTAYDTPATVRRVEGDTAWVHIPGGVDETPVKLTVAAKAGDVVQVRVTNGRAFIVGNGTAPPTDDTTAIAARSVANKAQATAQQAQEVAEGVAGTAAQALSTANDAETLAQAAQEIANATNQHFWVHPTTGAIYITTQEQDDYLTAPSGRALLITTEGMLMQEQTTEGGATTTTLLATFTDDGTALYQDGKLAASMTQNGIVLYAADGVTAVAQFAADGVQIKSGFNTMLLGAAFLNLGFSELSPIISMKVNSTLSTWGYITQSDITIQDGSFYRDTSGAAFRDGGNDFPFRIKYRLNDVTHIVNAFAIIGGEYTDENGVTVKIDSEYNVDIYNNTGETITLPSNNYISGNAFGDNPPSFRIGSINNISGMALSVGNRNVGGYSYNTLLGYYLIAGGRAQVVSGTFNEQTDALLVIGNGTSDTARSNALTVDWNGNSDQQGRATTEDMTAAEVSDFIDGLDFSAATLVDFIVEQGEGYGFNNVKGYYRKWNSGKCEFWFDWSAASGMTTAVWVAPIYFVDTSAFSTVWNGLFNAKPTNLQISSTNSQLINVYAWDYDAQGINKLRLLTCNGKTGAAYSFSLYAVGTWK